MSTFVQELDSAKKELKQTREDFFLMQNNLKDVSFALREQVDRCQQLEEDLIDLSEWHQKEIESLRKHTHDLDEKLQYQTEERYRDLQEMMEACQAKLVQLERQHSITAELQRKSKSHAIVLKLINVLLILLQMLLLLVAVGSNAISPFVRTRFRVLTSVLLIIGLLLIFRRWQS